MQIDVKLKIQKNHDFSVFLAYARAVGKRPVFHGVLYIWIPSAKLRPQNISLKRSFDPAHGSDSVKSYLFSN
jgi:hypothetical protein